MLAKLYNGLAIISIASILAIGAMVGLLLGSGRLTPERLETIAQVLRGELDEQAEATDDAQASGSSSEEAGQPGPATAASADEIRQQQREQQLTRALQERAQRDLRAQRELLDQALQRLITAEERFEEDRQAWKTKLEQRQGAVRDEGFEKELQFVAKLPPKQAKEHLVLKWKDEPAEAVRLLSALPVSTGKRVLEQLKTPQEIQIMHALLEQLSADDINPLEPGSGKTAGSQR